MKSICIIGQGNVGTHLCVAFAGKVEELFSIDSRTLEDLPEDADLYLLSVSDSAIEEVAARMPDVKGVVAHTSGSISIDALKSVKGPKGVFYPLMTFSKEADIDYRQIPVFIEASEDEALLTLRKAAELFSDKVKQMDSRQRKLMHIASVFACNFPNALWNVAYSILKDAHVPFSYMLPLIDASVEKLHHFTPEEAQTGPARRGDSKIVDDHMDELSSEPDLQKIYRDLSDLIVKQTS